MKLLALDLSTACTGWASFEDGKLKEYGAIKPKVPGISKMKYPEAALMKALSMVDLVLDLICRIKPDQFIIEEVNRGINRISQKTLDGLHFLLLRELRTLGLGNLNNVAYMDSNGRKGWRTILGIGLSASDKDENKRIRARNRSKKRKGKKEAVINWKTIAVRYINDLFSLGLSRENDPKTDGDIADAICLGLAYLRTHP